MIPAKIKTLVYLALLVLFTVTNTSFKKISYHTTTRNTYQVIIVKSKYELQIYDSTGEWMVTYPVVFG
ncbi:MAG: hypothetical protein AAB212_00060, partial [Bacteroidota bacterium]